MGKKEKRRHRRKKAAFWHKAGLFFMILTGVLLLLGLCVFAGYCWMENRGKSSLREKQVLQPQQMENRFADEEEKAAEEESDEALEEGEIRYQGKVWVYNEEMLTFLCLGIDKGGEVKAAENLQKGGQADAIFLVALDLAQKKISVIGVNRDTMTEISAYDKDGLYIGKEVAQIALQHAYGDGLEESCERTVEAVSHLFYGLPIHGYCAVNMGVIGILNDAVGGVDVTVAEDIFDDSGLKWKAGEHLHLEGDEAHDFVRSREHTAGGATARLARQKQYLQSFIVQAMQAVKQDMTLPVKLYTQIAPYMVTNISSDEVVYLAGQALSCSFEESDIHTMAGELRMGEKYEEFYQDDRALYELILDVFYREKEK